MPDDLTLETVLTTDQLNRIEGAARAMATVAEGKWREERSAIYAAHAAYHDTWRKELAVLLAPWEAAIRADVLIRLLDEFEAHFGEDGDVGLIEVRRWIETRPVHGRSLQEAWAARLEAIRADERRKVLAERPRLGPVVKARPVRFEEEMSDD